MLTTNLNSFLTLGYFLDYKEKIIPVPQIDVSKYSDLSLQELTETGSEILLDVFSESVKAGSKHLIPLSGGLDSRAILGGLLRFTSADNIKTFTYGVPGTFDFELGRSISKMSGVENFSLNFNTFRFSTEMLLDAARRFRGQTMLFFHPDHRELNEMFPDHYYWTGFFGDVASGDGYRTPAKNIIDERSIKLKFLENNRYVHSVYLANEPLDSLFSLLDGGKVDINNIGLYEKLDIFDRQAKYIAPHKCPDGFQIIAPYLSLKWLNFIMSVPGRFRKGGFLYHRILLHTFPDMFKQPTRNNSGLSLEANGFEVFMRRFYMKFLYYAGGKRSVQLRTTNYFDLNDFIRNNLSLKKIIVDSIEGLKNRDLVPWIDLDKLLNKHMTGKANYGDALQVLASLELILTSGG